MRIGRAGFVLVLLWGASACLLGPEVHPDFTATYRSARVVFIVPPTAAIWVMKGAGDLEYREDLSRKYQEKLSVLAREGLKKRGLKVAELEATPENDVLVEEVGRRFATTLPAFREADETRRRQAPFTDQSYPSYSLGDVSRLHEAAGADLLMFVDASATVETTESVITDIFLILLGGPGPPDEYSSVCVALVDRSGRLLFVGEGGSLRMAMETLRPLR
jgi:hypothetical protein